MTVRLSLEVTGDGVVAAHSSSQSPDEMILIGRFLKGVEPEIEALDVRAKELGLALRIRDES